MKDLTFMLMRSQREFHLTVGPFGVLSFALFVSVRITRTYLVSAYFFLNILGSENVIFYSLLANFVEIKIRTRKL